MSNLNIYYGSDSVLCFNGVQFNPIGLFLAIYELKTLNFTKKKIRWKNLHTKIIHCQQTPSYAQSSTYADPTESQKTSKDRSFSQ